MLLNGDEIRLKGLVKDYIDDKEHFRAASYDLRIGNIISVGGKELKEVILKPQGVVEVVSAEKVHLPMGVAGFAMVKTSLCNLGILPLNIGIIDPGYNGPLSATLLNFGKRDFRLAIDQVFLRLTFFECKPSPTHHPLADVSYEKYIEDKKQKALNFSETFLNLEATVKKVSKEVFGKSLDQLKLIVPVLAFLLAVFAFLVTLGVNYTARNVWSRDQLKAELLTDVQQQRQAQLEAKMKELEEQLQKLKGP
jgi:deoxycytidine triphosphate deaminase